MDYQERLNRQLVQYKVKRLGDLEDGTWTHDGEARPYPHILPRQQYRLNILATIRDTFWTWYESPDRRFARHRFFHHLNSSQALAFNLFFPFLDMQTGTVDGRLQQVLGLAPGTRFRGEFEKVLDRGENTSFDLYFESANQKIFLDVKLSEREFGSCEADERHRQKLETYYRPALVDHVDAEWLVPETFFKHYQILRNLSYLGRYPGSGMAFIFPRANQSLSEAEQAIKRIASRSLAPRIAILYLEALVARILAVTAEDRPLREHFLQFQEKYVVQGGS